MSSSATVKPNANVATTSNVEPTKTVSPLDALGEDDEFEDFPVENWTESESDISHLIVTGNNNNQNPTNPSNKNVTMDDLWEDNWDDEVLESDFANQLRAELEKTKSAGSGPAPMQT